MLCLNKAKYFSKLKSQNPKDLLNYDRLLYSYIAIQWRRSWGQPWKGISFEQLLLELLQYQISPTYLFSVDPANLWLSIGTSLHWCRGLWPNCKTWSSKPTGPDGISARMLRGSNCWCSGAQSHQIITNHWIFPWFMETCSYCSSPQVGAYDCPLQLPFYLHLHCLADEE